MPKGSMNPGTVGRCKVAGCTFRSKVPWAFAAHYRKIHPTMVRVWNKGGRKRRQLPLPFTTTLPTTTVAAAPHKPTPHFCPNCGEKLSSWRRA